MDKLKPCPFCGANVDHRYIGCEDGGYHSVECENCVGQPFCGAHGDSEEEVSAAWNTRTADTELAAANARIEELERESAGLLQACQMATENQHWQRNRIAELEEGLRVFAKAARRFRCFKDAKDINRGLVLITGPMEDVDSRVSISDLRRAAQLLEKSGAFAWSPMKDGRSDLASNCTER